MTDDEIITVMSIAKQQIEADINLSKSRCYEDIRERKIREMYIFYPAIVTLSAGKFKELWDKAA